jgi:hypothetical protein
VSEKPAESSSEPPLTLELDYASHATETVRRVPDEREPTDPVQRERVRRAALAMQSVICILILLLMLANGLFLLIATVSQPGLFTLLSPVFLVISSFVILFLSLGLMFIHKSASPTWHKVIFVIGLLWSAGVAGLILSAK